MRKANIRARKQIKKFITSWYDIGFLFSNMPIEANGIIYDMELKKLDFQTLGVRDEGKRKLVPRMMNTHTRAHE